MRDEIDNLELLHTGADLPATVAAVRRVVERAGRENPRLAGHKVKVYFLTDLQRTTWSPELGDAAKDDFRRQSQALAKAASLVLIDLGQPGAENLAVTGLRAVDPVAVAGRSVTFEATVKNFGSQPRNRQAVQWLVDRRRSEEQVLDLPPGTEKATPRFSCRFQTPGDHTVEVRAKAMPWRSTTIATWWCPCGSRSACCASTAVPRASRTRGPATTWPPPCASSGEGEPSHVVVDVAAGERADGARPGRLRLRVPLRRGPVHRQRGPRAGRLPRPRRQPGLLPRRPRCRPSVTIASWAAGRAGRASFPPAWASWSKCPNPASIPSATVTPSSAASRATRRRGC